MDKNIKVLFVDDDTNLGNMVSEGLKILGHEVLYISSFVLINDIITDFKPNIILLDVEIGNKNGIEESVSLRKVHPTMPIIFISSHIDAKYEIEAINNGGVIYLKKPIDIEVLNVYIVKYAVELVEANFSLGIFVLNYTQKLLINTTDNSSLNLNKKESELLKLLIDNLGNIVNRKEILAQIWDNDMLSDPIINNHISKLRKYLASDSDIRIETISREGYRLMAHK